MLLAGSRLALRRRVMELAGLEPATSWVADQQWKTVQVEDKQNQELLDVSHQILELTKQVHAIALALPDVTTPTRDSGKAS